MGYLPHSDFLFLLVLLKEQYCSHCQWPNYVTKPFSSVKVDTVLASLNILSSCRVNHSHTFSTDTYCKSASLWCITVKLCQASNWCFWALVRLLIKAEGFFQIVAGFLEPDLFLLGRIWGTLFSAASSWHRWTSWEQIIVMDKAWVPVSCSVTTPGNDWFLLFFF